MLLHGPCQHLCLVTTSKSSISLPESKVTVLNHDNLKYHCHKSLIVALIGDCVSSWRGGGGKYTNLPAC